MLLLFVPECLYCSYQSSLMPLLFVREFSDAFTVHTKVFLMLLLFIQESLYCLYQSSLMPLLFKPELSDALNLLSRDAFNVCNSVL